MMDIWRVCNQMPGTSELSSKIRSHKLTAHNKMASGLKNGPDSVNLILNTAVCQYDHYSLKYNVREVHNEIRRTTSCENVSSGTFDQVRFKPAYSVTETS